MAEEKDTNGKKASDAKDTGAESRAEDAAAGGIRDEERESARAKLVGQLKTFGTIAGMVAKQGVVKSTKMAMPLIRGYVGTDAIKRTDDNGEPIGRISTLTEEESATLMMAGEKLAFESIELASLAYPTVEGIEPYRAVRSDKGRYEAPHLGQLLSLWTALQRFVGNDGENNDNNGNPKNSEFVTIENPVLLTAVTADDYRYLNMPVLPNMIRRVALNERENMLMRQAGGTQTTTMAQTSGAQLATGRNVMNQNQFLPTSQSFAVNGNSSVRGGTRFASANASAPVGASPAQSCSSCGCSGSAATLSSARYNPDGTCMDTMCISCETKWRVRDCVKLTVCEFITCIADEFCVNGSFQKPTRDIGDILIDCLRGAMCTTLNCLPEAICGPRDEECCLPPPALECDFAVEEKR